MATPIIQSVGATSGAGTPGQGRNDLVAGEQVSLSDTEASNSGASYFWEFEDVPLGTAPVLTNHTTATPHFFVDPDATKAGSYRIRCTVDGIDFAVEVLSKPLSFVGARVPSFQERLQYDGGGNSKGWHEAETAFKRSVDGYLSNPGPGAAGDTMIQKIWGSNTQSHDSDTPLVVGAFALNPNDYALENTTVAFQFTVVAANGDTPLTSHVELYNLTDAEVVTSSVLDVVDTTNPVRLTATLQTGAAAGRIKTSGEKIYECRVYLDTAPLLPSETIELYSAEVRAVFTVTSATP